MFLLILCITTCISICNNSIRTLSIFLAKPVSPALPLLPLMESMLPAGDFGNVNKRCQVCRRCYWWGYVNGKRPRCLYIMCQFFVVLEKISWGYIVIKKWSSEAALNFECYLSDWHFSQTQFTAVLIINTASDGD